MGSKIPGLKVSKHKGIAASPSDIKGVDTSQLLQAALKRGTKRMEYIKEGEKFEEGNMEGRGERKGQGEQEERMRMREKKVEGARASHYMARGNGTVRWVMAGRRYPH